MTAVLDASALLAYLQGEPGSESIDSILPESTISCVNWAEVMQKCHAHQIPTDGLRDDLKALGLKLVPFTPKQAELAADLWDRTRTYGFSLADRACLATAAELGVAAITADRAWIGLGLGIEIRLIR